MASTVSRADWYLDADDYRPIFQGDVFRDVPFTKVRRASRFEDDPRYTTGRRYVAILGHPCDLYPPASATLGRVQTVGLVRELRQVLPADLDAFYEVCPLPDLLGDGHMWCVDFRMLSNVDGFYLDPARRVASLSEQGWTFFKFRQTLCNARIKIALDEIHRLGRVQWDEVELWRDWNAARRDPAGFRDWIDQPNAGLGGDSPRVALEAGISRAVIAAAMG